MRCYFSNRAKSKTTSFLSIIFFLGVSIPSASAFPTFEDSISAKFASSDPENMKDMQADPDNDGWDNFSEYLAGTDPRTPNASPLQVDLSKNGAGSALSFDTLPNRRYLVQYSADLMQWDSVGSTPISGDGNRANLQHSGSSSIKGFYRIAISLPPIHVKKDAPGSRDGTSWANAYTDLQPAINAAKTGQEIWVAAGIYHPTDQNPLLLRLVQFGVPSDSPRTRSFILKEGISILGGFSGTETRVDQRDYFSNRTILSGDLAANDEWPLKPENFQNLFENSLQIIYAQGINKQVRMDGFEITGGFAALRNELGQFQESVFSFGGGMVAHGSNIQINNCLFARNIAWENGGAIFAYSGPVVVNDQLLIESFFGKINITNTTFKENLVPDFRLSGLRWYVGGGAVYLADNYTGDFEGVTFDSNSAPNGGAVMMEFFGNSRGYPLEEGALSPFLRIVGTEFKNNIALCGENGGNDYPSDGNGGAIFAQNGSQIFGSRLLFYDNMASTNNYSYNIGENIGGQGGALVVGDGAVVKISASAFIQNIADWSGGAVDVHHWAGAEKPSLQIYFSLIYGNSAKWGAGLNNYAAEVFGYANIFNENNSLNGWTNDLANTTQVNSFSSISYSIFSNYVDPNNLGLGNQVDSASFINPQDIMGPDGILGTIDDGFNLLVAGI